MYNVFELLGSWILYDAESKKTKPLTPEQAKMLKEIFPRLFDEGKILNALQASIINPSKLKIPLKGQELLAAKSPTDATTNKI